MAYCDFTLPDIKRQFHCIIDETTALFASVGEVRGSPWLQETLRETLPLALAVHTEQWFSQKSGGDSAVSSEFVVAGMLFHHSRVKSELLHK